jgi:hypothetical protein
LGGGLCCGGGGKGGDAGDEGGNDGGLHGGGVERAEYERQAKKGGCDLDDTSGTDSYVRTG